MQGGVVQLLEVPRRADYLPQFTFYLFSARFEHLVHEVAEWSHQAAFNLRRRFRMEAGRYAAAAKAAAEGSLRLPPAVADAVMGAADVLGPDEELDDAGRNALALEAMEGAMERLRAGVLRLDTTILLMRDLYATGVAHITQGDVDEVAVSTARAAAAKKGW